MEWIIFLIIAGAFYLLASIKKKKSLMQNHFTFNLNTTTISELNTTQQSQNKSIGTWIQPNKAVKVVGITITKGYIYFGGQLKSFSNDSTEASLLDATLPINMKNPDFNGEQMNYWPQYYCISPESRAAYINWLAGDRNDPKSYIGYVFLYFYGIERRLLIDNNNGIVSEEEYKKLITEVERLQTIYKHNKSFKNYTTNFLSFLWAIKSHNELHLPSKNLLIGNNNFTYAFKYLLAKTVSDNMPISSELALAWVKSHPDFHLKTPVRRCPNEFNLLFIIRFKQKYKDAFIIKPNKVNLNLTYNPASVSLQGYKSIKFDLPDVSRLKSPIKKLVNLANSCTSELDDYSRYIGKTNKSRNSLMAQVHLPDDFIIFLSTTPFRLLQHWINTQIEQHSGLCSVKELFKHIGYKSKKIITNNDAEIIARLIEQSGFGMAPDIRYHHAKIDIAGKVVFFSQKHGNAFQPSHYFNQSGITIRLGCIIAKIKKNKNEHEVNLLENLISQNSKLSNIEKCSLSAYLQWRLNSPNNLNGLKVRLEKLQKHEKESISDILVNVALADGIVSTYEINQLEKIYTYIGLDKSVVLNNIHKFTSNRSSRIVQKSNSATLESSFLNKDLLKIYEDETHEIQSVLESIFIEESHINKEQNSLISDEPLSDSNNKHSIDEPYYKLFEKLITKEEWTINEVKIICDDL